MTGLGMQDVLAGLIVLAAVAWLVRRWWSRRGKSAGCEHCPSAAAGNPPCQQPPSDALITIGPSAPEASAQGRSTDRR